MAHTIRKNTSIEVIVIMIQIFRFFGGGLTFSISGCCDFRLTTTIISQQTINDCYLIQLQNIIGTSLSPEESSLLLDRVKRDEARRLLIKFVKCNLDYDDLFLKFSQLFPGIYTHSLLKGYLHQFGIMHKRDFNLLEFKSVVSNYKNYGCMCFILAPIS